MPGAGLWQSQTSRQAGNSAFGCCGQKAKASIWAPASATRETEGILCARNFAAMPQGAIVINIGRRKHLVQADLIAALDSGHISYAALDALNPKPLSPDNPPWAHPKMTVMPPVARRPSVGQLVAEIAANIKSIEAGDGRLQEIDKATGY
jgi:glyoxylate/hydroxypyruvate reductase A